MSLTFEDGTFAGQTIRVTDDGYASIYDIMRVAGGGEEPTHAWNKLKSKFCSLSSTSGTSKTPGPAVKYYKFAGRGQRDTPVINGAGLVRLLILLPGPKARQFAAESAETLVRFIGGDESLVAEIHRNREIAQGNSNSVQSFMRSNISTASDLTTVDFETEERRARLVKLCNENELQKEEIKIRKLEVLDKYKNYAIDNIQDARVKEHIDNEISNRKRKEHRDVLKTMSKLTRVDSF